MKLEQSVPIMLILFYIVLIINSHKEPTVNSGNQVSNRVFTYKLTGTWRSDVDCTHNEGFPIAFLFLFGQTMNCVPQPFGLNFL